ncbi:hypothetical protein LWI28_005529 [Acer negundo]|uniref:Uncharacterized protein n=1 Tax=Acer negundo TaxID=4023 RepID=A0AAD5NUW1_ACENE|nr:hypothetical protein LWI28_005529 [Acer negundo]
MEKMWKTKGGVYVALLVMLVMILFINANPSRATSLVPKMSNNSAGSGCSSIHDCLITDHQSLEFLLGSEADTKPPLDIAKSLNSSTPIADCGRDSLSANNHKHTRKGQAGLSSKASFVTETFYRAFG